MYSPPRGAANSAVITSAPAASLSPYMTRFVLIPTYDVDREFYMSKTKVGVDYFAT